MDQPNPTGQTAPVTTKPADDKPVFYLSTHRIESLSDCIFAFAMTLLVLTLILPDAVGQSNTGLPSLLSGQAHKFFNYFFSFLILAIFWITHHHQFHWIRRVDTRLLWINIITLMFVALMPFSTDIAGDFSGNVTAEVFFASNVMALGLLFLASWAYATHNHRLVDSDMGQKMIALELKRNTVVPLISAIVIGLSFFISPWSLCLYALTPFVLFLRPLHH